MEFHSCFSYSEIGLIAIIVENRMSKVTELRHILENSLTFNDINIIGISVELQNLSFLNEMVKPKRLRTLIIIIIISSAWAMLGRKEQDRKHRGAIL